MPTDAGEAEVHAVPGQVWAAAPTANIKPISPQAQAKTTGQVDRCEQVLG
jgi:hypothetical protein